MTDLISRCEALGLSDGPISAWVERIENLQAERDASETAWRQLDDERVAYINLIGDIIGQTGEDSLEDTARRVVQERDALAMQNQQLIAAAKGLMEWQVKNVNVWHNHAYDNMEFVISKSGDTEVIRKHAAGVLREAAERLESYEYIRNAPPINFAESHELRRMADELEQTK